MTDVLTWLGNHKDVVELAVEILLFFATLVLIRAGLKQERAADSQARAADQQVQVARAQVQTARTQAHVASVHLSEISSQAAAARRPFFRINFAKSGMNPPALLLNVGPGVALRTTWSFMKPDLSEAVHQLGAVGVNMEVSMVVPNPLTAEKLELDAADIAEGEGIRIEYDDTAGKRYWSTIKEVESYFVIETGEVK